MYDIENLYDPQSIEETITLLVEHPEAIIIAGGSDVLIKIHEGKLAGCTLINIHGISELEGISMDEAGTIIIKPLTTFSHITENPIIQEHIPVLGYAVDQVGGPQVRHVGTIGGNVCNGVTSADSASTLFALDAKLVIAGPNGQRMVEIADFYKGPGRVDLQTGEILTAIHITKESYAGYKGKYIKYAMRNAMDIATLGCSVNCRLNEAKDTVVDVRLAFGVAGPSPMRCHQAENAIKGMKISSEMLHIFSKTALTEVNPRTSWRASKEFRLQLVEELSKRALKETIILGGGVIND